MRDNYIEKILRDIERAEEREQEIKTQELLEYLAKKGWLK